jgi:D-alanyl-D-alanine carboxypeptidase
VLKRFQKRVQLPGISAAVLIHGGGFWAGQAGDRRVSTNAPVDARTVFAIASITKTFTAAAVMKLVADGQISLDDRLSEWVPSVPNAKRITVRQLLNHTSGIYNHFENAAYNQRVWGDKKHVWTFDEILGLIAKSYCDPGACYHYSNTNFVILGRIVELVTGHSLADEISAETGPLGLVDTLLQPDDATPADHANGYTGGQDWTRNSKVIPTMSSATVAGASGAMVSTASDLAHWADALYTGGVVPQPELDQMLRVKACHDNYGLGTRQLIVNGRAAYGHLGSLRGYTDAMLYFPREGATIVVLSNRGFWNVQAAVQQLGAVLWPAIGAPAPQFDAHKNTTNHDLVTLYC